MTQPTDQSSAHDAEPRVIRLTSTTGRPPGPQRFARRKLPRRLLSRLWDLGTWLAARRPIEAGADDYRRFDYRTQTRGMGLRMTDWLRNRLRPRWLKLRDRKRHP